MKKYILSTILLSTMFAIGQPSNYYETCYGLEGEEQNIEP